MQTGRKMKKQKQNAVLFLMLKNHSVLSMIATITLCFQISDIHVYRS